MTFAEINTIIKDEFDKIPTYQSKAIFLASIGDYLNEMFQEKNLRNQFAFFSTNLVHKIEKCRSNLNDIKLELDKNQDLLQKEESLNNQYAILIKKTNQLNDLKKKNDQLLKIKIEDIEAERVKYNTATNDLLKARINNLNQINQEIGTETNKLEQELKSTINITVENLKNLDSKQTNINKLLLAEPLTNKYIEFSNKLKDLIIDYNSRVEKFNQVKQELEEISVKHDKIIKDFKIHHIEDIEIYGALNSDESVKKYFENLSSEIEVRLIQLDSKLKDIIERRQDLPIFELISEIDEKNV